MYKKIEFSLSATEREFRGIVGDTVRRRSGVYECSDKVFYAGENGNPITFGLQFHGIQTIGTAFVNTDQEIDGVREHAEWLLGRKAEDFEYHTVV